MNAHVKPSTVVASVASDAYSALDDVATDLSTLRQLAEAIIRLTDDHQIAAVADQITELAKRAEQRRRVAAAAVHPYAFPIAA